MKQYASLEKYLEECGGPHRIRIEPGIGKELLEQIKGSL